MEYKKNLTINPTGKPTLFIRQVHFMYTPAVIPESPNGQIRYRLQQKLQKTGICQQVLELASGSAIIFDIKRRLK